MPDAGCRMPDAGTPIHGATIILTNPQDAAVDCFINETVTTRQMGKPSMSHARQNQERFAHVQITIFDGNGLPRG